MARLKKKGFTLIELIGVLVIMAIIALIVTPLVMNIIRKAKISARKRSVDAYGRSVELAIASYLLDTGTFPNDLHSLTVEYSGNTVVCNVMQMKENGGLYMSECSVNSIEVKDDTDDGYYHYGTRDLTNEEYVDMYGKNVESALKTYYDTNNVYPESIDSLYIESVGKTVACTLSINYDGTVYLTNCTVDGVSVTDANNEDGYYHYGRIKYHPYSIGDEVTYNNVDYYVIKNSDDTKTNVTLLKSEPLTVEEVNQYGVGHINRYHSNSRNTVYNHNGYGGIAYYTSNNCMYQVETGCITNYNDSDIKYIVDRWAQAKVPTGMQEARLITFNDLTEDLGYKPQQTSPSSEEYLPAENTPNFVYSSNYWYWTMTPLNDTSAFVYAVRSDIISWSTVCSDEPGPVNIGVVRPVVTIKKSAL